MDTCVDLETLFNESDNFTTDPCVDLESLFNELDGFNDDLEDNLTSIDFEAVFNEPDGEKKITSDMHIKKNTCTRRKLNTHHTQHTNITCTSHILNGTHYTLTENITFKYKKKYFFSYNSQRSVRMTVIVPEVMCVAQIIRAGHV
jgi:hypothetical protein